MSTLLPCPFCGARRVTVASDSGERFVVCECCDAESGRWSDAGRAASDWNTRPIESALRSRVEALEGVLQKIADAPCEREQGCIAHRIARAALQPDKGERLSQQERDTLAEARAIVESAQATREEMDRKYDDKGEDCATCYGGGLVNQIDPHHPPVACPACDGTGRQQPDKGERVGVSAFFGTWPGDESEADLIQKMQDVRGKGERCGGRGWFPLPRQERTPTGRNSRDCPGCLDCREERCGGTGAIPRGELTEGAIRRACDGCPDCSEAP